MCDFGSICPLIGRNNYKDINFYSNLLKKAHSSLMGKAPKCSTSQVLLLSGMVDATNTCFGGVMFCYKQQDANSNLINCSKCAPSPGQTTINKIHILDTEPAKKQSSVLELSDNRRGKGDKRRSFLK